MSNCDFVTFPCGILGQVWCLIVMIPGLCRLSYFIVIHCRLLFIWHCVKHGIEWNGVHSIPLRFIPFHVFPFSISLHSIPIHVLYNTYLFRACKRRFFLSMVIVPFYQCCTLHPCCPDLIITYSSHTIPFFRQTLCHKI